MRVNLKLYIVLLVAFTVSGCGNAHQTEISTTLNESIVEETPEPSDAGKEAEEFVKIYQEIYENAVETNAPGSLELVRNIVKCLGESGYVAVDSKNQIDMTEAEQVKQFCECVEKKEDAAYEYRPRGFYEVEFPKHPYPEVVAFTESDDGTITLMVNVVFPYEGISKVYAHEVVVRPLEDGEVQYVSNRVLPSVDNYEETWHTPRLTKGEWEEVYGRK